MNNNIQQAQNLSNVLGGPPWVEQYIYDQFQTGGPQDYKVSGQQYVDAGNFNYGAVCTAMGNSVGFCQSAAGIALIGRSIAVDVEYATGVAPSPALYNGSGLPFTNPPYGDQQADSQQIENGASYQAWYQQCQGINGN